LSSWFAEAFARSTFGTIDPSIAYNLHKLEVPPSSTKATMKGAVRLRARTHEAE